MAPGRSGRFFTSRGRRVTAKLLRYSRYSGGNNSASRQLTPLEAQTATKTNEEQPRNAKQISDHGPSVQPGDGCGGSGPEEGRAAAIESTEGSQMARNDADGSMDHPVSAKTECPPKTKKYSHRKRQQDDPKGDPQAPENRVEYGGGG